MVWQGIIKQNIGQNMAISLQNIKRGISEAPPIVTIYGDGGIGKDTFASKGPNPIFIFTENSLGRLNVERFSFNKEGEEERIVAESFEEVMESLYALLVETHEYKSVVISTVDWLEPLIWKYLLKQQPTTEKGKPVNNILDYGYGSGYKLALDCWKEFLDMLAALRSKGIMPILIAHHTKDKVTPPDGVAYDSYHLKLQNSDKVSARDKVVEYSDIVLFANWKMGTTEEKLSGGKKRNIAVGSGDRTLYTEKRPSHYAKNRYGLPPQIHVVNTENDQESWLDVWGVLASNIPWFKQFQQSPAPTPAPTAIPEGETMPAFLTNKQ